tara:strand:- start:58 stop:387 length:330 start_codon:yes stop_codon:yes gene_type:complete
MAVTWSVIQTERETTNNGITTCHWNATESETVGDGDSAVIHTGDSYGSCGFTPDHTAGGFTAYASVTEANAIAWVKASMGADEVAAVEAEIAAQITESKTPTNASGVPW